MRRSLAGVVVAVAVLSGCNRDKAADVPVQQQATDSAPLTTSAPAAAPATKTAPAPAPARPAPPSPEALAAAELAVATRVHTVQVGSFPNAAAAEWWAKELQRQGIPAYTTTGSFAGEPSTRLRVGATLSAAEARAVANKIHARYKWPIWITTVTDKSELPPNALFATRNYIR